MNRKVVSWASILLGMAVFSVIAAAAARSLHASNTVGLVATFMGALLGIFAGAAGFMAYDRSRPGTSMSTGRLM